MTCRPVFPILVAVLALALGGCMAGSGSQGIVPGAPAATSFQPGDEALSPVPQGRVPARFRRHAVRYVSSYAAGSVVVDTQNRFLYLVESPTRAIRYGISVGTGGFDWSGEAVVGLKRPWPRWTPPAEMIGRAPNLSRYRGGLAGGGINPLGARALYLYQNGHDTLYRLHGTSEWWSIGKRASSGCIRLLDRDAIDLYDRVDVGARVVVLPARLALRGRS